MKLKTASLLLTILLAGVYWLWLLPGPRVATDFSLISHSSLKSYLDLPQTWTTRGTEGLGEYTVFTLWSWPFNFLYGFFANLGLSFAFLQRILIVVPFLVIGSLGIWKLCESIKLSSSATIISVLFYLTNTYILLLIDGGQLSISLVYALFPLGFLAIEQAIYGNFKKKILAGLLTSAIGIFDIRFIYIFSLLVIARFLYEFFYLSPKKWMGWIIDWLRTGLVIFILVLGLNAFWLLVITKQPIADSQYLSLTKTSFTGFISLSHSLLLLSPHWFMNVFGRITELRFEFILIPLLVFLAPILKNRNRLVGFWLLVALISVFLTKGSAEPLSQVYQWLYYNIPGFSLFRDSSKFFFLVALSYTVLIGITVDETIKRVNSFKVKIAFILTLTIFFVFLVRPVWSGWMTGTFSKPALEKEFSDLDNFIAQDKSAANVFWIPTISPLTMLDPHHPAVEASRLAQKRPFQQATKGSYEIFNFLREASYMGQLFEVANIKYIVYPPLNPQRTDLHPDNFRYYSTFLKQLSDLPWLTRVENLSIPVLEMKKYQEKLFIAPNIWWVIGSDSIYNEATKSTSLSLSKNALIFVEETLNFRKRIQETPNSKIVLYKKYPKDLTVLFISEEDLIFPARELNYDPNSSGWWKRDTQDFVNLRQILNSKYLIDNQDFDMGGGWAIGEGSLNLKIQNSKIQKGKKLLARALESSQSGQMTFFQNAKNIGKINTAVSIGQETNLRWFEIGELSEDYDLIISSEGKINIVNALATVSSQRWQEYSNKFLDLEKQNRIVNFEEKNTKEENIKVSYKQISSTKYTLTVENLSSPSLLIFSQNYDKNWKLNGQTPLPVYSLLNGYYLHSDGQYELEFKPQKYILPGLIISIITLLTAFALLLV